jgi:hypothetical protein
MKCYHCNEEIIWGNDFDLEEDENEEYGNFVRVALSKLRGSS